MYDLSVLGFDHFFERQSAAFPDLIPARIAAENYGAYEVWAKEGSGRAQLAGRLRHEFAEDDLPGVGDWVGLKTSPGPDNIAIIEKVFSRRTVFTRGASGREARAQVVAANVDLVFIVCGLGVDFSVRRIERYLARIWAGGAQPAVILNKADTCGNALAYADDVEERCPGVSVYLTSALHAEGLDVVRGAVAEGVTAAVVGSSGAGKSTLVNALVGENIMDTGEVRARDGRGCHVTTRRQLVLLPGGGMLLDTPGMRELQIVDEEGLDAVFADIEEMSARCRFKNCRHDTEPGCAVKKAVSSGEFPADRLENYRQLEREARANELRHDEHKRRKSERVWGQLHDEVDRLRRWKRGE
jgi:ribosome biogenesis GTPase / thiamine phosphate phosphatase